MTLDRLEEYRERIDELEEELRDAFDRLDSCEAYVLELEHNAEYDRLDAMQREEDDEDFDGDYEGPDYD